MSTNFYFVDVPAFSARRVHNPSDGKMFLAVAMGGESLGDLGPLSVLQAEALEARLVIGCNGPGTENHIGKRSAAGPYCWTCRATLCKGGESKVHYESGWHDACPKCGGKSAREPLEASAAGKELGFNSAPLQRSGVRSCCSFTWGLDQKEVERKLLAGAAVEDEYGRRLTAEEFKDVLADCPIQFHDSVGVDFT